MRCPSPASAAVVQESGRVPRFAEKKYVVDVKPRLIKAGLAKA
jgi:hypothetical protein